jgi:hypothetical protein
MSGVATTPGALDGLRSALGAWAREAAGIAPQASAAAAALAGEAEHAVRVRAARRSAIEALLRAAREREERGRLERELQLATESLEHARRALQRTQEVVAAVRRLERRTGESVSGRVPAASHELGRKLQALADYRAVTVAGSPPAAPAPAAGAAGVDFRAPGIVDVPIDRADFADNPILDGFRRGGAELSDYRWAVETWETIVRPGVLAGQTREDFARRDAERGRHSGLRRTAGVYDLFLGSDPIHFSRRADGSLSVDNGRHRVEAARQLGITHLPGRLSG